MKNMQCAERLYEEAFSRPRDPRSEEYKAGVKSSIQIVLSCPGGYHEVPSPYPLGTVQADAFFSGCLEGSRIAREWIKEQRLHDSGQER